MINQSNNIIPIGDKNLIENNHTKFANKKLHEKDYEFKQKTNKNIVKNAISCVCLAGNTNSVCRTKILEILENCNCDNFIMLFKDNIGRKVSFYLNQIFYNIILGFKSYLYI